MVGVEVVDRAPVEGRGERQRHVIEPDVFVLRRRRRCSELTDEMARPVIDKGERGTGRTLEHAQPTEILQVGVGAAAILRVEAPL